MHLQIPLVFFVTVPDKVVVDIGNKAFIEQRFIFWRIIFIGVELKMYFAKMSFRYSNRSQKSPCHSEHVIPVKLFFIVSVEKSLMIEVKDLEENNCIRVQQQMARVVDVKFLVPDTFGVP